jgi:hypothetical protein
MFDVTVEAPDLVIDCLDRDKSCPGDLFLKLGRAVVANYRGVGNRSLAHIEHSRGVGTRNLQICIFSRSPLFVLLDMRGDVRPLPIELILQELKH